MSCSSHSRRRRRKPGSPGGDCPAAAPRRRRLTRLLDLIRLGRNHHAFRHRRGAGRLQLSASSQCVRRTCGRPPAAKDSDSSRTPEFRSRRSYRHQSAASRRARSALLAIYCELYIGHLELILTCSALYQRRFCFVCVWAGLAVKVIFKLMPKLLDEDPIVGIAAASPSGQKVRPIMFSARYRMLSRSLSTPPPACTRPIVFFPASLCLRGMECTSPQLSC